MENWHKRKNIQMNYLLLNRTSYDVLYNCANFNIDAIPLQQRQRFGWGAAALSMFAIFELAYIPCAFAIWRHLSKSCYKIMFVLAIVDILSLCIVAFFSGLFGLLGFVFCSNPLLIYFLGMLANCFYGIEACSACLLAINRCLDVARPQLGDTLFRGHRTWLYYVPISAYSLYYGFFTKSILWSSVGFFWTYDPYFGYPQGANAEYTNLFDQIHCGTTALLIPSIYIAFFVTFKLKTNISGANSNGSQYRSLFIQTFLICVGNTILGAAYSVLYLTDFGPVTSIFLNTFTWILTHGMPPMVYLSMNNTLRNDVKAMLRRQTKQQQKQQVLFVRSSQAVNTVRAPCSRNAHGGRTY